MNSVKLEINPDLKLREWRSSDEKRLYTLANNENLSRKLLDSFPHPYTRENAAQWIEHCQNEKKNILLAIEFKGEFVGGIGAHFKEDIHRYNVELGYWVGEPYWGQGIISKAIASFTDYLFSNYKINRVYGEVFENNTASAKVLEKNGFTKEAVLKKAAFKNGFFIDLIVYSKLK